MVVDELKMLFARYEEALLSNDLAALKAFFWDSPQAVRFGQTENLFGAEAIDAFRQNRPTGDLLREVIRVEYLVLDDETGVINMCFKREFKGVPRQGRQTQVWRRFSDVGWKIVSAHVSFLEEPS